MGIKSKILIKFFLNLSKSFIITNIYYFDIINYMFTTNKHLFIGIIFSLPFFGLNTLVLSGVPILRIFRLDTNTAYEQILILSLIFLVFIGGLVSLYPVIKNCRFMVLNIIVAILFIGFSFLGGYGLAKDFYHCDILQIPNCD